MTSSKSTPGKMHTWILVLLFWIIALLVFIAGYIIYNNKKSENEAVVCPVIEKQETPAPTCPATDVYTGPGPHFSYPIDWEVFAAAIEGRSLTIIRVSKDPLWLCDACDGPENAITISFLSNDEKKTLETFIDERYTENNGYGYRNVTMGAAVINGTSVLRAKGQFEGMGSGPFEEIISVTPNTIVIAQIINWQNNPEENAAWNVITSSLDFSTVE